MSGRENSLLGFFAAGTDLGFDCFELSGIHRETFYDEVRPGDFCIVSLHDPAPPTPGQAHIGSKELRLGDVVYTSLVEERRRQAVAITRRSIDVAGEYGASVIVLHPGQTGAGPEIEKRLKQLFALGEIGGKEAQALRARLAAGRAHRHDERMRALHRSLDELVDYASARHVRLGLENRPANEIAGFSEIGEILSWYPSPTDGVGYWHDTGHAQVQAALGSTPHADWLLAYGSRMLGMHLHDAAGVKHHHAPGSGNVDWTGLAPLVPTNVIRVLEINDAVSADEIRSGTEHSKATGRLGRVKDEY